MAKEIVLEDKPKRVKENVQSMSLVDLFAVRTFIHEQREHGFIGKMTRELKGMMAARLMEVEDEIYLRVYGYNPIRGADSQVTVVGVTPEKVLAELVPEEDKGVEPEEGKTFTVFKKTTEEE